MSSLISTAPLSLNALNQFLGADPTEAVTTTGFNGFNSWEHPDPYAYGADPAWVDLKLAQVSALVERDSESTQVTLTVDILGKTDTWDISSSFLPDSTTICKSWAQRTIALGPH